MGIPVGGKEQVCRKDGRMELGSGWGDSTDERNSNLGSSEGLARRSCVELYF